MRVLFWLLGPISSRGAYRVPSDGPVLILSNHISDVDPIAVQVACPRAVHFMAKSELFEMKLVGRMIRWFQAFPVKRGEPDRAAMRHAIDLLKMGEVVSVFPEGQLSEDGELQELKPGVALIVRQAGAPVICCGIRNSNKVMPYGSVTPRFSWTKITVEWGEVRSFTKESTTEEILEWTTQQLRELSAAPHQS
jgi:1-acyl-sn-glycerol-3-phosphate acyltransferase